MSSAVYVLLAVLVAFILPIDASIEGFKIEVDPSVDWGGIADACKKPFTRLSDGVHNRIFAPTRNALHGAIPFKPFFRRRRRMRKMAKMERTARKERMRIREALDAQKKREVSSKTKKS